MSTNHLTPGDDRRTFAATVAYDGSQYGGWQRQINSMSVQQRLEEAIELALGVPCKTQASGRTDAGVHAVGQIVRFRTDRWQHEAFKLAAAINRWLPPDIAVQEVRDAVPTFSPPRDAISKTYAYSIRLAKSPDPFDGRTSWYFRRVVDIDKLILASQFLIGEHDFISFQAIGSPRRSTIRTIFRIDVRNEPARHGTKLTIEIEANGFLYNMARCIVGSLVEIASRNLPITELDDMLKAKSRRKAGQTAPAHGLCLMRVNYPSNVFPIFHLMPKDKVKE